MNKSCFLIKLDCERLGLISNDAIRMARDLKLNVYYIGQTKLSFEDAMHIYKNSASKNETWFLEFIEYLISGEVKIYFTEGEEAILKTLTIRKKIRDKYSINQRMNAIHAPDKEMDAQENRQTFINIFNK